MRILLTNDDGIEAAGLHALYRAVAGLGEIHVVAPAKVQSATSHAITLHKPMAVTPYACELFEGFAVHGRPADCVKLAVAELLPGPVDLVLSGINHGANVGVNVHYSGTVGAAREGAFLGLPAIALSLHIGDWDHDHWARAAKHARDAIDVVLAQGVPPATLVNVNVPILDGGKVPKGMRAVPLNTSAMHDRYTITVGPDGEKRYQAQDSMSFSDRGEGTDVDTLFAGYTTLTPLHFEQTDHVAVERLSSRLVV
ncbi:MAG: 5'/3'-nucleotidase SurE [Phycisphaerales bacterium JB063]